MDKNWRFNHSSYGTSCSYKTKEDAITAAKKSMDKYSKAGYSEDIVIYESVAAITFPVPAYEVVDIVAKA